MFAHYDSVQVSYGGNDDGAGVSTLLETARVLAAGPRPRNDIVFLFTDAEEACLCGAQAFVDQSPLAAQGGVAMNFESRGSSGPVVLFETSRGNANVVGVYADAVPYPVATSFAASTPLRPSFQESTTRMPYCSIVSGCVLGTRSTAICDPLRDSNAASLASSA